MKAVRPESAFTLIELLVVMSILGILAAITVPALKNFGKSEAQASAVQQMLDDVRRARQLAISQRTTVYMIFLPASFWNDDSYIGNLTAYNNLSAEERTKATKLLDKQINSYTFVAVRSVGDQPGRSVPRYLSEWRTLPEGTFIAPWKFRPPPFQQRITDPPPPASQVNRVFNVRGFAYTDPKLVRIPFPSEDGRPDFHLPYIAFNHLGQLVSQEDEFIPLARGSLAPALDVNKFPVNPPQPPSVQEKPVGNSTNAFTLVRVEWITGRARIERQEVQ